MNGSQKIALRVSAIAVVAALVVLAVVARRKSAGPVVAKQAASSSDSALSPARTTTVALKPDASSAESALSAAASTSAMATVVPNRTGVAATPNAVTSPEPVTADDLQQMDMGLFDDVQMSLSEAAEPTYACLHKNSYLFKETSLVEFDLIVDLTYEDGRGVVKAVHESTIWPEDYVDELRACFIDNFVGAPIKARSPFEAFHYTFSFRIGIARGTPPE